MNPITIFNKVAVFAVLVFAQMITPAIASVDFNSNANPIRPKTGGSIISGEYTFSSSSVMGVVNGSSDGFQKGVSNGTPMLVFANAGTLTVTRSDGTLFGLNGLDVGGWYNFPSNAYAQLSIDGLTQTGGHVSTSSGSLSVTSFAHVSTSSLFKNLVSLTINMTGYSESAYAAIDNLALTTPVPEPDSVVMFVVGLALLAGVVSRQRAADSD